MGLIENIGGRLAGYWSRWGGQGVSSRVRLLLPGSRLDYEREAGDLWSNGTVALGLKWIGDNYTRPTMRVSRLGRSGEYRPLPRHPLVDLMRRPNPYYTGRTMAKAMSLSIEAAGEAFLIKVRGKGTGRPVQLWWHPHWAIAPCWPADGSSYIDRYEVRIDGVPHYLPPSEVIHIRDGLDPRNERLGLSTLKAQLRAIVADNESDGYTASVLRNLGVPGLVISMKGGTRLTDAQAERAKEKFRDMHTGENRGDPILVDEASVTMLGFTPEQLRLEKIPQQLQARILAAMGVSPMVLGLPDPNKTYSNLAEARRAAWENCLVPLQDLVADTLRYSLLPDFGDDPATTCIEFDYTHVESLQEAQELKSSRLREEWKAGIIRLNEARAALGYETDPDGERYYPSTGAEEPELPEEADDTFDGDMPPAKADDQAEDDEDDDA